MENIGKSFRVLRKERGFTLKTMSEDIISYSYLSKFENGESKITLTNFVQLVNRLNMTVDEFLFFNNFPIAEYMDIFQLIAMTHAKNDVDELKKSIKIEEDLYKETNVDSHRYNAIMIAVIITDIDPNFPIPESDIELLVDYFLKCSYWTTYEISLFGNVLPLFSEELLVILLAEVKKRIKEHQLMHRNYRDLVGIIQNACIIFLREKKINQARSLSDFSESILTRNHFFGKTRKLYIDGAIELALGNQKKGTKKAMQAIGVMEVLDKNYAEAHRTELERFKEMYAVSDK